MQNIEDLQDKIFFESKSILENLAKITSREELLGKQELFSELTDRISFLKILDKNMESFIEKPTQAIFNEENGTTSAEQNFYVEKEERLEENRAEQDRMEEEVLFTNEINDITENQILDEVPLAEDISRSPDLSTDPTTNIDETEKSIVFEIDNEHVEHQEELVAKTEMQSYEERVAQREKEFLELEERRRKIVEFMKKENSGEIPLKKLQEEFTEPLISEKKFKLSSIKGLKVMKNLFDEDPLDEVKEVGDVETGSLLRTNISTEFMEAAKKKPEFRLDLNDKVAFTKLLFHGDEAQLKETIEKLNSYDNVEDAKKYLSELYYQNDWAKVDEYAQRLWILVENKFF